MSQPYAFTYVIGYRHRMDRLSNLKRVLEWINGFNGVEVLLIEQDRHSKVKNLNLRAKHIFVKSDMPYNRSWAFNIALKYAQSPILVFGDSDLMMNPNEFIEGLKALQSHEMVSPYYSVVDLTQPIVIPINCNTAGGAEANAVSIDRVLVEVMNK